MSHFVVTTKQCRNPYYYTCSLQGCVLSLQRSSVTHRRDGVVVRVFALHAVDQGFILSEYLSHTKRLSRVITKDF